MTRFRHVAVVSLILVVCIGLLAVATSSAQDRWLPPRYIPQYADIYTPILVADENRTVHALNSSQVDDAEGKAINYRQWTVKGGWTVPIDVYYRSEGGSVSLHGAYLDRRGIMHVLFYEGDPSGTGDFYHIWAPAREMGRSVAWSTPQVIAENVARFPFASMVGDEQGRLVVVYTGEHEGLGVYETHSIDSGTNWSEPVIVAPVVSIDLLPVHIQTTIDQDGQVHAVWAEANQRALGEAVHYARLDADLRGWSKPTALALREGNDYMADWPSVVGHQGELIVIYYDGSLPNGVPPTRWMRRSNDGGETWSYPNPPFPHVGGNGSAELLTDSSGRLHMVFANRVGNPAEAGMWHSVWLGDDWSPPEPMAIGSHDPQLSWEASDRLDTAVGNASRPTAVISQGNMVLATWWHDMRDPPPAAYTYGMLDAPELPVESLPHTSPSATPSPTSTPTISVRVPAPTPQAALRGKLASTDAQSVPGDSVSGRLITSILPVLAIMVATMAVYIARQSHQ